MGEAYDYFKESQLELEVTVVNISRGAPMARYLRYEALNPVHIFSAVKGRKIKKEKIE